MKGDARAMDRNRNWLIAAAVVLALVVLACCVLAAAAATVGWVADDAVYGPMMRDSWDEDNCPGCPGHGPVGMRSWAWPVVLALLGLLGLAALAAAVVGAIVWAGRSNRPRVEAARDVPEVPDIEE
jgi:outer membrane murein-binding lipoprotein Lpp